MWGAAVLAALLAAGGRPLEYDVARGAGSAVAVEERFSRAASPIVIPGLPNPFDALHAWVEASASAVAGYYGRLPVARVHVTIHVIGRGRVSGGVTHGGSRGARIDVTVGPDLTAEDLADDWVLTHEFVHTALPRMPDDATWFDEGIATYVEPIARVRRGGLAPEQVWKWLAWGMPKGMPAPGDEGLDHTHTWGRTYWGGTIFCFLADLALREKTGNRVSLREALIGILDAGGDVNASWDLDRILAAGDKATGTTVLTDLHAKMGGEPFTPDLDALFARLGVRAEGRVTYDDAAPLAAIRRAIPAGSTVRGRVSPP